MRDEELITAYVDGVAELTPEERRRAEAAAKGDDLAATREVLHQLRSLRDEGTEPDWGAMERAISAAVGHRVPRSWWRLNVRWLVPALACATAAAIALIVIGSGHGERDGDGTQVAHAVSPSADPHAGHAFVYLDGQAVDVDDVPEAQLLEGLRPDRGVATDSDDDADDGLLNSPGLAWVDQLDNSKLDRVENALAEAPSKKGS
jgi:hypothetical protein